MKPKFSTYIYSIIGGYALGTLIVGLYLSITRDEMLSGYAGIFSVSLVIAVPVIIVSIVLGYPIFRIVFRKIGLGLMVRTLISIIISCLISMIVFSMLFDLIGNGSLNLDLQFHMLKLMFLLSIPVLLFASIIYWAIEENHNKALKNEANKCAS